MQYLLPVLVLCSALIDATLIPHHPAGLLKNPFPRAPEPGPFPLEVDLGYSLYKGIDNQTSGLYEWRGIRYAQPPVDALRWQSPAVPKENRTRVIPASSFPHHCPQAGMNIPMFYSPKYAGDKNASEDCLFLNVYAPPNSENLPVWFYIHPGGYAAGDGTSDHAFFMDRTPKNFVSVVIQYRLGAFGFMAGPDIAAHGVLNAGMLDQTLALQWVQRYIHLFGGDPSRVTIAGESAGAGSVILHSTAYGGTVGTSLWQSGYAASTYLPPEYPPTHPQSNLVYNTFVEQAGCNGAKDKYACLQSKDTLTLQKANYQLAFHAAPYGLYGYAPVIDGDFIRTRTSVQLAEKRVNGKHIMVGTAANEGVGFTPFNLTTQAATMQYLHSILPGFSAADVATVLAHYPLDTEGEPDSPSAPQPRKFATDGVHSPSALNTSSWATGEQQRADNILAELVFVCPRYWLADAFSAKGSHGRTTAHSFQWSVIPATHASTEALFVGPQPPFVASETVRTFVDALTSLITKGDPGCIGSNKTIHWPQWEAGGSRFLNLNQTGGVVQSIEVIPGTGFEVDAYVGNGLEGNVAAFDGDAWEGGRGKRCDFWREMSAKVPY